MSENEQSNFEDALTWNEANDLRIVVSDHRRALHAQLLLAQAEGNPTRGQASARHDDAVRLESKVMAMFNRVSNAR